MVDAWLPYGNTETCVRVPTRNFLGTIEPAERAGAENPQAEIENALKNPLGTGRLAEIVKSGDKVVIVLKDLGTSTNQMMILPILNELSSTGVRDENIRVIVAHDPLQTPMTKEKPPLSEGILSRIKVVYHDCEADGHVYAGKTSLGTEVHLNRALIEADVKILTGVVEPHLFAGYSGGRDGILPGVSSLDAIKHNLSLCLHPKAGRGSLEGNPVHRDMVEAAHLAGVHFALNLVRNSRMEVVKAFGGDVDKVFDEGTKLVDEMFKVSAEVRSDVVFISPGGFPFDASLFEACKGLDGALEIVKKGGVIVLEAECIEGYGNVDFYESMSRFKDPISLEKSLKKRISVGGLMAYRLMRALQKASIILVSILPDYYAFEVFRLKTARTANEALRYAFDAVGKKGKVSFIPRGNMTMPIMKG